MGFALLLYRIDGDQHVESNRDGLNAFLKRRRMRMKIFPPTDSDRSSSAILLNEDGSHVDIGGILDLHFSDVLEEEDKTMTAWLGHAHLTADECDFIFDLCVSAGFVIANPQEDPSDIVPRGNHTAEQLRAIMESISSEAYQQQEIVVVNSGKELQAQLIGTFQDFLEWRDRVFAQQELNSSDSEAPPGA